MLKLEEWKKEKDTLHMLSQILGKYKLECAYQEPQWAHVILDITLFGFSTGLLFYKDKNYMISVNLIAHQIEVYVDEDTTVIRLEDGKPIKEYYLSIKEALNAHDIYVEINTTPQEFEKQIPFEEDTTHSHYKKDTAKFFLDTVKFALRVETKYISKFRARKVKPGLFWGTFDVSCMIVYNKFHEMFDESEVIEAAAFDEHIIEFGMWFGDERYEGPTFFVLSYPFVDESFTFNEPLTEPAFFDKQLTELVYEIEDTSPETMEKLYKFMQESFKIFKEHLEWNHCDHYQVPLKMEENLSQQRK